MLPRFSLLYCYIIQVCLYEPSHAASVSTLTKVPSYPSVSYGHISRLFICIGVYSNSRNDVPRVAQRYGTTAAHTRRRASVPVVFVVFCVHMHSFAGLIRRTPPPTFSDTAITDSHSDTTIFQLRAHWVRISWSIGSEKSFEHVPPVGVEPSTPCVQGDLRARRALYPLGQALRSSFIWISLQYLLKLPMLCKCTIKYNLTFLSYDVFTVGLIDIRLSKIGIIANIYTFFGDITDVLTPANPSST